MLLHFNPVGTYKTAGYVFRSEYDVFLKNKNVHGSKEFEFIHAQNCIFVKHYGDGYCHEQKV